MTMGICECADACLSPGENIDLCRGLPCIHCKELKDKDIAHMFTSPAPCICSINVPVSDENIELLFKGEKK